MAVPKSRTSRSRTRSRRAQWLSSGRACPVALVEVRVGDRRHRVPRRLVRAVHLGYVEPRRGAR